MKKLLVALILAVVLSLTLATPALAWGPGDMPDGAKKGLERATEYPEPGGYITSVWTGIVAPWYYGEGIPPSHCNGSLNALRVILYTLLGG